MLESTLRLVRLTGRLVWCGQLVAVAPSLEKTGEVTKVTAYTSDLIELVSGVSPVRPKAS